MNNNQDTNMEIDSAFSGPLVTPTPVFWTQRQPVAPPPSPASLSASSAVKHEGAAPVQQPVEGVPDEEEDWGTGTAGDWGEGDTEFVPEDEIDDEEDYGGQDEEDPEAMDGIEVKNIQGHPRERKEREHKVADGYHYEAEAADVMEGEEYTEPEGTERVLFAGFEPDSLPVAFVGPAGAEDMARISRRIARLIRFCNDMAERKITAYPECIDPEFFLPDNPRITVTDMKLCHAEKLRMGIVTACAQAVAQMNKLPGLLIALGFALNKARRYREASKTRLADKSAVARAERSLKEARRQAKAGHLQADRAVV